MGELTRESLMEKARELPLCQDGPITRDAEEAVGI
jgi:hypothetical protein